MAIGDPPTWGSAQPGKSPIPSELPKAARSHQTPTDTRLRLLRGGYHPLPLEGKNPAVNGEGWQTKRLQTNPNEIRLWASVYQSAKNTGVLCRDTPFVDLDILDPDAAAAAERLIKERFDGHTVLTRIGHWPKRAFPFQTATPFQKFKIDLISPDGTDKGEKIELLCDGQQCVVDGIHPDTRQPYRWHGGILGEVARGNLPVIDAATGRALVEDIAELLVRAHGYQLKSKPKPPPRAGIYQDPQGGIHEAGGNGADPEFEWTLTPENLIDHDCLTAGAMALLRAGMNDGAIVNFLRSSVSRLPNVDEDRRQRRLSEIPGMVSTARAKIGEGVRKDSDGMLWWHGDANPDLDRAWIVDRLLPETGTALISGQWGVYKTFVALDLSLALMVGTTFAGRQVKRRRGVLFVAAEGAFEIPLRLQCALEAKFPEFKDRLPFALARECPRLLAPSALSTLESVARGAAARMQSDYGVKLGAVIIDTMAAAARFNDEADNAEAQRAMGVLNQLALKLGCVVIAVDHFGKVIETGTRGASAKEASADSVLAMLGDKELSGRVVNPRLAIRKVRGAPTGGEVPFTTRVVDAHTQDDQTTLVIDWQAERGSAAPPKEFWPRAMCVFRDALIAALDRTLLQGET